MTRVLYIAYPLLPVTRESAGGAEQILAALEREVATRGYDTAVAACAGSQVAGRLIVTGSAPREIDAYEEREAEHSRYILEHVARWDRPGLRYDLVHDMSGSFWRHAGVLNVPVLATLHLPRSFYREEWFARLPSNLFFNGVSEAQVRTFADIPQIAQVVQNGIALEHLPLTRKKGEYLLWLGRFCEEKGPHVAIDAARRTGMRLVLAGQIYPFSYHQQYFERCIRPCLESSPAQFTFVGTPAFAQKRELLRFARALLVPSLCEETSSLVAMEAMACGTPVIAFRRGSIAEIVRHGETGFLVDTPEEMAEAAREAGTINSFACRSRVEALFSHLRMADDYGRLYQKIAAQRETALAA
jgi:glycosyltransferase involved in cell wall biosynthesis